MDPFEILGKRYPSIISKLESFSLLEMFESLEDGEDQKYYLKNNTNTIEMLFGMEQRIETIFFYYCNDCPEFFGISYLQTKEELITKFGTPVSIGHPKNAGALGEYGAWEKFLYNGTFLHVEHEFNSNKIKMLTLMVSDPTD